jgi:hypothetical protein
MLNSQTTPASTRAISPTQNYRTMASPLAIPSKKLNVCVIGPGPGNWGTDLPL